MPDQQPTPDPCIEARQVERDILYLLTDPDDHQPLWTLEDLEREMEDPDTSYYINSLQRAGLIHRTTDGHIFASRAAVRHIQIVGRSV